MASYESIRIMNTILTLYYLEEMTQTEIAQRMGRSVDSVKKLWIRGLARLHSRVLSRSVRAPGGEGQLRRADVVRHRGSLDAALAL